MCPLISVTTSRKLAAFKWELIRNEKDKVPIQSSRGWLSQHTPKLESYKVTQNQITSKLGLQN